MQKEIHPKYVEGTVTCACGASFQVKSKTAETRIGICSQCHPFYTGKHKLVDTAGRVDRFKKRYGNGN